MYIHSLTLTWTLSIRFCAVLLITVFTQYKAVSQITFSSNQPDIRACYEADTVRVVLYNTGTTTVDSVQYNPEFPSEVYYVAGSILNGTERSTSNLNKPSFSITQSISGSDSVVIKYVIKGGCDLNDKTKFPFIKQQATQFVSSVSTTYTANDTLATFVVPDLAISNFSFSGSAYTFVKKRPKPNN